MALDPNKVTLCWPNYTDIATLSGGSYTTPRPLANAGNRIFAKKARATSLDPADTQFQMDLPSAKAIQVLSIAGHNFSITAKIRMRFYLDQAKTVLNHDSGWVDVWPAIFGTSELEWEYNNFWFGTINDEDRKDFTPLFNYFLPEAETVETVVVEIDNQSNPQNYVEFGRVFLSEAWQPEINVEYGVQFGYQNKTLISEADDGTEYFDDIRQKRTMSLTFGRLTEDEAFEKIYGLQRTQGVSKEILVAFNQVNTPEEYTRKFIGRASQLDPISQPFIDNYEASLNLLEIV